MNINSSVDRIKSRVYTCIQIVVIYSFTVQTKINTLNMDTTNNNNMLNKINSDTPGAATAEMTQDSNPTETNATTQFVDDSSVVTGTIMRPITGPRDLYTVTVENFTQDIKTFLAKPIIITNNVFQSTDTVSTFADVACPTVWLNNTMIINKLNGFYGIRATMVFKIVVNATRFQQGRYIMAFIHTGGLNTSSNSNASFSALYHKNTITARTQLPHVEVDLNCDTSAVLTIPYCSALNHTGLQAVGSIGEVGLLHISPYSALSAGSGSTTAAFTVYGHLEDVELVGACAPQSGITQKEKKSTGQVTSVISTIKQFTDALKQIPPITAYATPVSWVVDASLKASKSLGWSKPFLEDNTKRVVRDVAFGLCNSDVQDVSKKQSVFSNNSVGILPGYSGTDIDELAISHIATRTAALTSFTMATNQANGTLLWSDSVTPTSVATLSTRTITGGTVITDYTPLQFCSSFFKQWHGSIVYRFKIVKTEFHSGRIAISFLPSPTAISSPVVNFLNTNYVHRAIIDLRDCNEYTVTVPYVSAYPYQNVSGTGNYTGTIAVHVVDALQSPSTVSAGITILVEHCAGTDMEFAIPVNVSMIPAYNVTPQSAPLNSCSLGDTNLGSSQIAFNNHINGEACVGEKVVSFRVLLKTFNNLAFNSLPTSQKFLNIRPFAVPMLYQNLTNQFPATTGDYYSAFSAIFLFSRGGVRFKVTAATNDINRPMVCYNYYPSTGASSYTSNVSMDTTASDGSSNYVTTHLSNASTLHHTYQNMFAEIEIPQYNLVSARVNSDHMTNVNLPYAFTVYGLTTQLVLTLHNQQSTFSATETYVYRAMADDGDFGRFISIGPMYNGIVRSY